jgi:hypothetical protein
VRRHSESLCVQIEFRVICTLRVPSERLFVRFPYVALYFGDGADKAVE